MQKKNNTLGIILVAGLFSRYASDSPDGLESVIESREIPVAEANQPSPLPDYGTPGVAGEGLSVFIAAAAGVVVVFLIAYGAGWLLSRRQAARDASGAEESA